MRSGCVQACIRELKPDFTFVTSNGSHCEQIPFHRAMAMSIPDDQFLYKADEQQQRGKQIENERFLIACH